jgi:hypothetical protein
MPGCLSKRGRAEEWNIKFRGDAARGKYEDKYACLRIEKKKYDITYLKLKQEIICLPFENTIIKLV